MFSVFETAVTEIAIGQIQGYIKPTKAERNAAYELFIELSSRTATVTVADEHRLIRNVLDNLGEMPEISREVLRRHGTDSAKDRKDGNVALAAIALRVVNEVMLPRLNKWDPLLASHEERRDNEGDGQTAHDWEQHWPDFDSCRADLESMRDGIRAYLDTLARVAGAPTLADLVVPNPPGAPIAPTALPTLADANDRDEPRRRMVGWVDPIEGIRTLLAQHGHDPNKPGGRDRVHPDSDSGPISVGHDLTGNDDLWIDYVSDLGDGIDPTLAIAWQLTRPQITLPIDRTGELPVQPPSLPRGRLLVMGGDQIYPHASAEGYRQQTILPYRLAASVQPDHSSTTPPQGADHAEKPDLVAIPGNHDWLGGREHFEEVFVRAEEFAEHWKLRQTERWWAIDLQNGWWMWGLDTALDNTLDDAQIEYFKRMSEQLSDGDQVIVCTPVPLWQLRQKREDDYFRLRGLLSELILQRGARTPLFLSGDSHFFAQYRRVDGSADEHHITAGGGGAFLQPTHNLPEHVPYERGATEYKLGRRWPRPVDSRDLGAGAGAISQRQFRLLFVITGLLHAAFAGLIRTRFGGGSDVGNDEGIRSAVSWVLSGWVGWPLLAVIVIAMIVATVPNSRETSLTQGAKRYGAVHGIAQIAVFVGLAAAGRWIFPGTWWWRFIVIPAVGGVVSIAMFVTFIRWINRSIRASDTLAFSPAHLTRYKHFLRMRLKSNGDLTVYAVGIDPVGKDWFEALTKKGGLVPPYDPAGVPGIHYLWGHTFSTGSEQLVAERERLLGNDHPDTVFSRAGWARRLMEKGDATKAAELCATNVESCRKTFGVDHPTTIANKAALADSLSATGEHAKAINLGKELLQRAQPVEAEVVERKAQLAKFYSARAENTPAHAYYSTAIDHLKEAIDLSKAIVPVTSDAKADLLRTDELREQLAQTLNRSGDRRGAIDVLRGMLEEGKRPAEGSDAGRSELRRRSLIAQWNVKFDANAAKEELTELIGMCEKELPEMVVDLTASLADALAATNDFDRATLIQTENLKAFEMTAGRGDASDLEYLQTGLAELRGLSGDAEGRVRDLEGVLDDAADGDNILDTWQRRLRIAMAIAESPDLRSAILQLEDLAAEIAASEASDRDILNTVRTSLALCLRANDQTSARALDLLTTVERDLVHVRSDNAQKLHVRTLLASHFYDNGNPAQAIEEMKTLLRIAKKTADVDDAEMRMRLAEMLFFAERGAEVQQLLEPELVTVEKVEPERIPIALRARELVGLQYLAANRPDRALGLFQANLELARDQSKAEQLKSLANLALVHTRMKHFDEARELRTQTVALAIEATNENDENDDTVLTERRHLASLIERLDGPAAAVETWKDITERSHHSGSSVGDVLSDRRNLMLAQERVGDLESAINEVERILRDATAESNEANRAWADLGRLSVAVGDIARGIGLLEWARGVIEDGDLTDTGALLRVQRELAKAYAAAKRPDEAVDLLEVAAVTAASTLPRSDELRIEILKDLRDLRTEEHNPGDGEVDQGADGDGSG